MKLQIITVCEKVINKIYQVKTNVTTWSKKEASNRNNQRIAHVGGKPQSGIATFQNWIDSLCYGLVSVSLMHTRFSFCSQLKYQGVSWTPLLWVKRDLKFLSASWIHQTLFSISRPFIYCFQVGRVKTLNPRSFFFWILVLYKPTLLAFSIPLHCF